MRLPKYFLFKVLMAVGLLAAVVFVFILQPMADNSLNSLFPLPPPELDLETPALHETLFVSDLHADTLLWDRDLLKANSRGHVDIPRLQQGNIALQALSVVTKASPVYDLNGSDGTPDAVTLIGLTGGWPAKTWTSLSQRALYQAEKLKELIKKSKGQVRLISNRAELNKFRLDREQNKKLVGVWLSIEGGHALDGDLAKMDLLFEQGFRMMAPVHLFDNELAGSLSGHKKHGLTELGKKWIQKAEEKNIIIDLAHLSEAAAQEVLATATRPVMVSHTGIYGVCPISRNLSDEMIKAIAAKGGLIGIGLWKEVLCEESLSAVVRSIRHVCNLVGCQHVALGSDWDGTVTTAVDSAHIGWLTAMLIRENFSKEQIAGVMGENVYHFLSENLP